MGADSGKEDLKGTPTSGLVAGTVAFFAGFAAVALFGTSAHQIAQVLDLPIVEVGWLVSIPIVSGAFLRIPFSALVDRYGGKPILTAQLIIALTGMIGLIFVLRAILSRDITSASTGYVLVMLFGALAGTGVSTFSSGITYVSFWYPRDKQGFALGTYAGFGNVAPGIFTAALPFALISIGLVYSYISWTIFLTMLIVVFLVTGSDSYCLQLLKRGKTYDEAVRISGEMGQELFLSRSATRSLANSAREWRIWLLVVMYFISFGGFEALTEWFPTFWQNYVIVSPAESGLLTGIVFSLVTAIIRVPGGFFSDRFGGELVAMFSYSIMIAGSIIMVFSSSNPDLSVAGTVVMALGMGIANAAVYKLVTKYAGTSVGGASGWVGGLGSAGGLLIPPVMASFVAVFGMSGYALGFMVFTSIGLVSVLFSLILLKFQEKQFTGNPSKN